jgi:hypothetical protein
MGQSQKIKYTALQRRALLLADLDTGRLPVVDDRGHAVHLAVRRALVKKGLLNFVSLDHYDLTALGVEEARRLQDERRARQADQGVTQKSHKTGSQRATTSRSVPQ